MGYIVDLMTMTYVCRDYTPPPPKQRRAASLRPGTVLRMRRQRSNDHGTWQMARTFYGV